MMDDMDDMDDMGLMFACWVTNAHDGLVLGTVKHPVLFLALARSHVPASQILQARCRSCPCYKDTLWWFHGKVICGVLMGFILW